MTVENMSCIMWPRTFREICARVSISRVGRRRVRVKFVFFFRSFSCDQAEVEHVQSRGTSRSVNQPLFLIEFFL